MKTSTSGYELRYNILCQARDILFDNWHSKRECENAAATFENRAPRNIDPPTVEEIKQTAESLYQFVLVK